MGLNNEFVKEMMKKHWADLTEIISVTKKI
jgi:hypothetical protein